MAKTTSKGKKRDHTARVVADITGYSVDMVNRVRNGDRENDDIMATLVDYQQMHNKLVNHLKQLIPLEKKRDRNRKLKFAR